MIVKRYKEMAGWWTRPIAPAAPSLLVSPCANRECRRPTSTPELLPLPNQPSGALRFLVIVGRSATVSEIVDD